MIRTVPAGSMIRTGEAEMRKSFGCLASGVAVVAARGPRGLPVSIVASSFNSVSLDPPILLWCVEQGAWSALDLGIHSACGVSILADTQPEFSGRDAHWECGDSLGVPLLARAAASFEVVITRLLPQGENMLCFAEVARFGYQPGRSGALRYAGRAAELLPLS